MKVRVETYLISARAASYKAKEKNRVEPRGYFPEAIH